MSGDYTRPRGEVPTVEDIDPLDWAIDRLTWANGGDDPWGFGHDWENWRSGDPLGAVDYRVIKALIRHLIRTADYDGLTVAMNETFHCYAEQELLEDRRRANSAVAREVHAAQLAAVCPTCDAQPGRTCRVVKTGKDAIFTHARRGA